MRSWCVIVAGAALCAVSVTPVRAQSQSPAVRVAVTGRIQVQWNSTSVDEGDTGGTTPIASSTFETRRIRLGADVQVSDWVRGRIEPEWAMGRLQLKNAWVSMELDPALVVRVGQFKKPFSAIFLTSSTRHAMIERGVRIRGLDQASLSAGDGRYSTVRGQVLLGEQHTLLDTQQYLGYDLGAAFEGRYAGLGWSAGVFNGAGPDTRNENDALSAAARVTYDLSASQPFRLGAAWSRRELNWPGPTDPDTRAGNAFEVDLEYGGFRRGLWLIAEASTGRNLASRERFLGGHFVGSYFSALDGPRVEGVEPLIRVSWGDPDRTLPGDAGLLVTPGVNLYFFGQNRLQFNWDVYRPEGGGETQHAARAQANLIF
jgi:hypothetical protein